MSSVIGQGSFGCVHQPSLQCDKKNIHYTGKISKLLKTKHAQSELNEYNQIEKIDPNYHYFLGKPEMCQVKNTTKNILSINKCGEIGKTYSLNPQDFSLLVMKYGGSNLTQFAINSFNHTKPKMEQFWKNSIQLFYAVKLLLDNDTIHHDLKAENILYNNGRFNLIDFGLVTTKTHLLALSKQNINKHAEHQWFNYPLEILFYNKDMFDILHDDPVMFVNIINDYIKGIIDDFINNTNIHLQMNIFFSYIHKDKHDFDLFIRQFIMNFREMLFNMNQILGYDGFINKSLDTFDSYGLALSLMKVLDNTRGIIKQSLENEINNLLLEMLNANLISRITIYDAINKMEMILSTHFPTTPKIVKQPIVKYIEKLENINPLHSNIVQPIANLNPQEVKAISCPNGKEHNELLKMCVKTCPKGKFINAKTRRCNKVFSPQNFPTVSYKTYIKSR